MGAVRGWAALAAVVVLAGCGSARGPEDWRSNHVDAQVGQVRLVHVHVVAPPMNEQKVGQSLPLYLTLFNDSDKEQVLDQVSTEAASAVVYVDASGARTRGIRVVVPPKGQVSLQEGSDRPHLELAGTTRQLGATPFPVTFRFPTAGSVTVRVAVKSTK
ncbi:copper chaperone PCu(A)C [Nonomuraea sp. NPDC050328]|uniref:copper chaperone PCu(A)C n=1 Tax=Nonomuraea sp. NPDC050328 TaxID=3364361 RepID=UPI0037985910